MTDTVTDTVTIDRTEYDRLVNAAGLLEDIVAYDAAMAGFDAENALPDAFMKRLLDGESPLKVFREWRSYNQSELSRLAGVSRVQINDIEAGRANGSAMTLKLLAQHLRVDMEDLVPTVH